MLRINSAKDRLTPRNDGCQGLLLSALDGVGDFVIQSVHMALEDIRLERIAKIRRLNEAGILAYPATTDRASCLGDIRDEFDKLTHKAGNITVAGRVTAKREHGGSVFLDLADESGVLQLYFKRDVLGDAYDLFTETVDIGDFIEADGKPFRTKKEEETVEVRAWRMLAKSLRPLPEKWHGLKDVEERFRRRYLDLLANAEVRERFRLRSALVHAIRNFFNKERFMEVETPILHPIAGGALARPFMTHHNALETDFYLRIAPELYLKRLLVGGLERIYEIGKSFRNEGVDATHNPEFTTIEWYAAYWDEQAMMRFVERCLRHVFKTLARPDGCIFDGKTIAFEKAFARLSLKDALARYALIVDYDSETPESIALAARRLGIEAEPGVSKGKIADEIFKKICRPHLVQPTFVTHHPRDISPLAKSHDKKLDETRRFQLVIGGLELVNAFAELNDPLEQRLRFDEQMEQKHGGETESHEMDEDFIEALEYGMPPAAGAGMSIDRLTMLLTNAKNIREVILFPTLRPKETSP